MTDIRRERAEFMSKMPCVMCGRGPDPAPTPETVERVARALDQCLREAINMMDRLLIRGDFDDADHETTKRAVQRWRDNLMR